MGWKFADDSGLPTLSTGLIWVDFVYQLRIVEVMQLILNNAFDQNYWNVVKLWSNFYVRFLLYLVAHHY